MGNVPFGQYRVNDKAYNKFGFSIHNYFFAKAIDQVRPGGIVAFVTSRYTLDSKDSSARKHIAERADLLGAIRLPNTAFKANAGTEVVSDIIFLQKRDRPIDHEPDWVQLGKTVDGFTINQYFVDHPEMVLGVLSTESTQYGREELTVAPIEGANLADQLAEAVQHIEGQYTEVEVETPDIADAENEKHILPADPEVKNFSYTVVDGEVFYRENSVMTQVELSDTAKGRVTGMVELRQIVNELIQQQLEDYPDEDIKATQERLNAAYDAFTAKYGLLNDRKNGRLFEQDSSYYLLCSLENLDEQGQLKSKAAMFTKRTIRPERTVTSVDTPSEALAVSIGEHGKVDLPYMAELLGTPGDYGRITTELSGVIFKDPAADPTDPEVGWQMLYALRHFLWLEKIPVETLMQELMVSDRTFDQDLNRLRRLFRQFGLSLHRRHDVLLLTGMETGRRRLILFCIKQVSKVEYLTLDFLVSGFRYLDVQFVHKTLMSVLPKHNLHTNGYQVYELLLLMLIQIEQIQRGNLIEPLQNQYQFISQSPDYAASVEITTQINRHSAIAYTSSEVFYLALLLFCKTACISDIYPSGIPFYEDNKAATQGCLHTAEQLLTINYSQENFPAHLAHYFSRMQVRQQMQLSTPCTLLRTLRNVHPLLVDTAAQMLLTYTKTILSFILFSPPHKMSDFQITITKCFPINTNNNISPNHTLP